MNIYVIKHRNGAILSCHATYEQADATFLTISEEKKSSYELTKEFVHGMDEKPKHPLDELVEEKTKEQSSKSPLDYQHGGSHYKDKGIQPIDYINSHKMDFNEGNVVKYVTRHKDKDGAKDIRKAIHYAQFILHFKYGESE